MPRNSGTWAKGQSGNPSGGRPKGSRNKLSGRFLHNLNKDWQAHGMEAIERMREAQPVEYVKLIASLLPKEAHVTGKVDHQHTHAGLSETDALISSMFSDGAEGSSAELSEDGPILPH